MLELDQNLASQNHPHPLSKMFDNQEIGRNEPGIFEYADTELSQDPNCYKEWLQLEAGLVESINKTIQLNTGIKNSTILTSQKYIRSPEALKTVAADQHQETEDSLQISPDAETNTQPNSQPNNDKSFKPYINENYADVLVGTPAQSAGTKSPQNPSAPVSGIDYSARESANKALGTKGEQFVLEYEKHHLNSLGLTELAEKVTWASQEIGDGLGFDIISYDKNGNELFIEVKATNAGLATPFFLTTREVQASVEYPGKYRLYRVFYLSKNPKLYIISGAIESTLKLTPDRYKVFL